MNYEVKTPILSESIEVLRGVISGLSNGSIENASASKLISAARGLQSAVTTDIKARLAMPKIAAFEAKLIEGSNKALENQSATG